MKLCVQCKHYRKHGRLAEETDVCNRDVKPGSVCPVTGERKESGPSYSCHPERWHGKCGEAGQYWEKNGCPMPIKGQAFILGLPRHHPSCDCNEEGGDR